MGRGGAMAPRDVFGMVKEAFKDWNEDDAPRLGAALSYYTIFSIAPLLLISIAVAGLVFGAATLVFGAGGAFNELRGALDVIWEIPPRKGGGLLAMIRERLASFAMVLVVGFLLLVSLVISAGISAFEVTGTFPGSGIVL